MLFGIHPVICDFEQLIEIRQRIGGDSVIADARFHLIGLPGVPVELIKLFPEEMPELFLADFCDCCRDKTAECEFIAAEPCTDILLPGAFLQCPCNGSDCAVTLVMPVLIVDALEPVQIDRNQECIKILS